MRVISNKALIDFAAAFPAALEPLQIWRRILEASELRNFAELRRCFNTVDRVGDFYVFDVGGNKYRVVTAIHFNRQMVYVRHVYTHAQYDRWRK